MMHDSITWWRGAAFLVFTAVLSLLPSSSDASSTLKAERLAGEGIWVDPMIGENKAAVIPVTVWFEDQFLGDGEAYLRRSREFAKIGRTKLRKQVGETLRDLSKQSQEAAHQPLRKLLEAGVILDLKYHWIVNGFSCRIQRDQIEKLHIIPGVRKIFLARVPKPASKEIPRIPSQPEPIAEPAGDNYTLPWYTKLLKADRVWQEFGVTGEGVLNVVHDGNFLLSSNVIANRYQNPLEKLNQKDDSGNGLVDDLYGFDFFLNRPKLTRTLFDKLGKKGSKQPLHGHQCVAIICGRETKQNPIRFGIAPGSKWAGVLAAGNIETAVEWAIEQGADTYSMSFSRSNLREYQSHWRKLMEHGTFCGVHFVSGAGNAALEGSPRYAEVPNQMRVPENIPQVVFAAAGVQRDLSRTPFSSQGPVMWDTEHYQDGLVDKPEVAAFNYQLPLLLPDGTVREESASGNSYAGPMFCGTIALMLSANPELNPWEVRQIIIDTATEIGSDGFDYQTGHGLINTYSAVAEAINRQTQP